MTARRRKYVVLFLTWLIATPIACAVGMGVSALWDRVAGDSNPGASHILPLFIVTFSTALTLALAFRKT